MSITPWLLFFASGNCLLIVRMIFTWTEFALMSLSWYTTKHLTKVEDSLYYLRLSKSVAIVLSHGLQVYFRYTCTLFKGWWVFRLCLALLSEAGIVMILWNLEKARYTSALPVMHTPPPLLTHMRAPSLLQERLQGRSESPSYTRGCCSNEGTGGPQLPLCPASIRILRPFIYSHLSCLSLLLVASQASSWHQQIRTRF